MPYPIAARRAPPPRGGGESPSCPPSAPKASRAPSPRCLARDARVTGCVDVVGGASLPRPHPLPVGGPRPGPAQPGIFSSEGVALRRIAAAGNHSARCRGIRHFRLGCERGSGPISPVRSRPRVQRSGDLHVGDQALGTDPEGVSRSRRAPWARAQTRAARSTITSLPADLDTTSGPLRAKSHSMAVRQARYKIEVMIWFAV